MPPIALRADAGAVQTALTTYARKMDPALLARFGLEFALKGIDPSGPFSRVLAAADVPPTSLVYRWFDFLAFALSGLPVTETSAAAVSFMMKEFFADGAVMDVCCPRGDADPSRRRRESSAATTLGSAVAVSTRRRSGSSVIRTRG